MPTRRRHSPRARSSTTAARPSPRRSPRSTTGAAHLEARRLAEEPITLKELADEFGVSRERVRQIGVCAFEKVQKAVKHRIAVMETPPPLPVR